jgi:tRNA1Val (adenine37-N6)-methyltransferase
MSALSKDAFLCGKLHLWQPVAGYRAATDAVLLAAACPAIPGQSVLDLGCGAGAAALCVAARVGAVQLSGLELQAAYADLARRNAQENGIEMDVHTGDLMHMPAPLRRDFDHVITNPPYYAAAGTLSPNLGRATALHIGAVPLGDWVRHAARRVAPRGWLTLICGADGLPEVLAALPEAKLGSASVLPLAPRAQRPALRIILRARKTGRGAFRLLAPFVIHAGDAHEGDRESYTAAANAVLRGGQSLSSAFD